MKRWERSSVKASAAAKPRTPTEETLIGIQKLVWHPPPLRVNQDFLQLLEKMLMESCRDTVDAMVIAYKRTHERELATPGGADQLLAYYAECKEKIVPHYMLELKHGPMLSLTAERNLQDTISALSTIPRGEINSLLITTRGAKVSTSLYLTNNLLGQSQITVAGSDGFGASHLMQLVMDMQNKWQIRAGFIHTRLFAVLLAGALQSIYLTILFQLLAGMRWLPVVGLLSLGIWVTMAATFAMAFPSIIFHLGKPPDYTRWQRLAIFILLNLLFLLGIAAAILFPL
jgi:hypothetical protein